MKITLNQLVEIVIEGSQEEIGNLLDQNKYTFIQDHLNRQQSQNGLKVEINAEDDYEILKIVDGNYLYEWEEGHIEGLGGGEGRFILTDDLGNPDDDDATTW
jgi:hypothetical protein